MSGRALGDPWGPVGCRAWSEAPVPRVRVMRRTRRTGAVQPSARRKGPLTRVGSSGRRQLGIAGDAPSAPAQTCRGGAPPGDPESV